MSFYKTKICVGHSWYRKQNILKLLHARRVSKPLEISKNTYYSLCTNTRNSKIHRIAGLTKQ